MIFWLLENKTYYDNDVDYDDDADDDDDADADDNDDSCDTFLDKDKNKNAYKVSNVYTLQVSRIFTVVSLIQCEIIQPYVHNQAS